MLSINKQIDALNSRIKEQDERIFTLETTILRIQNGKKFIHIL